MRWTVSGFALASAFALSLAAPATPIKCQSIKIQVDVANAKIEPKSVTVAGDYDFKGTLNGTVQIDLTNNTGADLPYPLSYPSPQASWCVKSGTCANLTTIPIGLAKVGNDIDGDSVEVTLTLPGAGMAKAKTFTTLLSIMDIQQLEGQPDQTHAFDFILSCQAGAAPLTESF